ncbi:MAG: archease [Candidatus Nanoarchaeia archaeon]|nr:archease [Candidatus Nanoarchaeia archaeon]
MKYRIVDDLTSDVMFEAYGKGLKEVFANSALAMFSVICNVSKVKAKKSVVVNVNADNASDLLYKWLSMLVALVDTKGMFFSKFEILEIDETHLKAKVYGEPISPEKGETVVKAVLYYGFKLEKTKKGYAARVGCDI